MDRVYRNNPPHATLTKTISRLVDSEPIHYHVVFTQICQSLTAGVLLSYLLDIAPREIDEEGWICRSQADIEHDTGLSRYEQESARGNLARVGILDEQRRGLPARLYFRIDFVTLATLVAA